MSVPQGVSAASGGASQHSTGLLRHVLVCSGHTQFCRLWRHLPRPLRLQTSGDALHNSELRHHSPPTGGVVQRLPNAAAAAQLGQLPGQSKARHSLLHGPETHGAARLSD